MLKTQFKQGTLAEALGQELSCIDCKESQRIYPSTLKDHY